MKLRWSERSLNDLEAITQYIASDNPTAAYEVVEQIISVIETVLPDNPRAGRIGRVEGTRELIVLSSYMIAYIESDDTIDILTVRHAARLWPESF